MQTIVAETTKPPAYPFIIHQCQRAQQSRTKNNRTDPTLTGPTRPSFQDCQTRTNTTASPPQHPSQLPSGGSLRPRRLGEAVSSQTRRNPQVENSDNVIFSSPAHVLLHFSQPNSHISPNQKHTTQTNNTKNTARITKETPRSRRLRGTPTRAPAVRAIQTHGASLAVAVAALHDTPTTPMATGRRPWPHLEGAVEIVPIMFYIQISPDWEICNG